MTALLAAIVAGQVAAAAPALAHATPGSPDTPTASAQPMVRAWWPDAGAGATASGLKLVDQHVRTMAGGGFGGMEVAFLSDELPGVPQSATLPPAQRLGQPGVDQNMAQTGTGTCCLDFSNAEAKQVGFGTENWQRIVTQIYRTANSLPGGFVVDLTLSQHWPVAFNNLDPNDLSQHQYARTAYSPITTADVDTGRKTVPVPAQRLWDLDNVPFVFVDHYQAATVVKVASVAANGTPTFGYASLTDVSGRTDQIKNSGTPAGIMDAAWIESHPSAFTGALTAGSATISGVSSLDGAQRQAGSVLRGPGIAEGTQILSVGTNSIVMDKPATATTTGASVQARWNINTVDADWGPAPARPTSAKVDNAGNRRRMADRQHQYRTTLDKSTLDKLGCTFAAPGAPLAAGNCVLFGTWNQGTGQTRSGGVNTVVPNREYATSIYDKQGTQATIDFWENNILGTWHDGAVTKRLGNTALINLIKANARKFPQASLFEDSLEFSKPSGPGNYWSPGVLAEMSNRLGYDAARYAPVLAGGATFDSTMAAGLQPSDRVTEDWTGVLSDDFTGNHVAALQNWAEKTLDYNFRIQDIGGTGVRHAQLPVGVHETSADSGAAENGRQTQAAAALTGSNWVTAESLTFTRDYTNPWSDVVEGLNNVWAAGVNRPQWHGTPFPVTFNGKNSAWPGWEFQHGSPTGWGAFDSRQTYWGDVEELTGYVSRMQTVLQSGDSKADLAVLRGSDQLASPSRTAYSLPTLLNHGWNYQVIDDRMLKLPSAVVRGKVLAPEGPAYRGIVVSQATRLEVGTVKKLTEYARAGLPVILFGSDIARVYGTNQPGNNDAALAAALATLEKTANVRVVGGTDQAVLLDALTAAGLSPSASYDATGLITIQRSDHGKQSYYLYNSSAAAVATDVTLRGTGRPAQLDAWSGTTTPVGRYTTGPGTVTTTVTLAPHEATVLTVGGQALPVHATAVSSGTVRVDDGDLILRSGAAAHATVELSNGRTRSVAVSSVPAAADTSAGWNLSLQSWGPDAAAALPTTSKKTTVEFGNALGAWSALNATPEQLATLGVTGMAQVSGVGTYSKTVQLPSTWRKGADGAVLTLAHGNGDEVVAVTVNGTRIATVNQVTDAVDLGHHLHSGANSIEVEVASNLGNRVGRTAQTYGLTGVTFTPYTENLITP